jgi:hypothetical protein
VRKALSVTLGLGKHGHERMAYERAAGRATLGGEWAAELLPLGAYALGKLDGSLVSVSGVLARVSQSS